MSSVDGDYLLLNKGGAMRRKTSLALIPTIELMADKLLFQEHIDGCGQRDCKLIEISKKETESNVS